MDERVSKTLDDLRAAYGYAKANGLNDIAGVLVNAIDAIIFQQSEIDKGKVS